MSLVGWESAEGRLGPGAKWYAESMGWKVFPVWGIDTSSEKCLCGSEHREPKDRGKHPIYSGYARDATDSAAKIDEWWSTNPEANIGLKCKQSGLIVLDIDPRSEGLESLQKLEELLVEETGEGLPSTVTGLTGVYTQGRGRHLFFALDPEQVGRLKIGDGFPGLPGIDVQWNKYVVISPSRHPHGNCYEWETGHAPWEHALTPFPTALLRELSGSGKLQGASGNRSRGGGGGGRGESARFDADGRELKGQDYIDDVLENGVNEGARNGTLHRVATILANLDWPLDNRRKNNILANVWAVNTSSCVPPLDEDEVRKAVESAITWVEENPPGIDITGIPDEARAWWESTTGTGTGTGAGTGTSENEVTRVDAFTPEGVAAAAEAAAAAGAAIRDGIDGKDIDFFPAQVPTASGEMAWMPRSLTDQGNGRRLLDFYAGSSLYTTGLGWVHWDDNTRRWVVDSEERVARERVKILSRLVLRERELRGLDPLSDEASRYADWAPKCKSNATQMAALAQWRVHSELTRGVDTWDADPNLLGVANGVVDLRTGKLLESKREMAVTRYVDRVSYVEGLRSARWEAFLDAATGGDKEFERWLQLLAGYTLTGSRRYDYFFILWGPPGSGKTTFLESVLDALGGYGVLHNATKLEDSGQSASDEYLLADLRGRRLLAFSEFPEEKRLKESLIKQLTGDATVTGRVIREMPITFKSQAKIWFMTNNLPPVYDEAMWRRIIVVPFLHVPDKPDGGVKEFCKDPDGGLPAVLSWAVEGAVRLLSAGDRDPIDSHMPNIARRELMDYRSEEDRMTLFFNDELTRDSGASVTMRNVHQAYSMWSTMRGEKAMSMIAFAKKLKSRGYGVVGHGEKGILEGWKMAPAVVEDDSNVTDMSWARLNRGTGF